MASGYTSESSPSTYIRMRLYWSTSVSGTSGHNVYVELQLRRTNSYSGSTFQYPSSSWINVDGNEDTWNWNSGNYPSIPGNDTSWKTFCSRTVFVSHTGATTISISGGNSSMGSYLTGSVSGSVSLEALYTAPSSISGSNEADGTVCGRAKVKVSVGSWGQNSSAGTYRAGKSQSTSNQWGSSSSATFTFNGLNASTSLSSTTVNTWYPGATNNHSLTSWGGAKYITSPSALNPTAVGNTNRSITVSGSVTYKGGQSNSSTDNSGTIARYMLWYKRSDGNYTALTSPQQNKASSATSITYDAISYTNFDTGYNYVFKMSPVNTLGAYAITERTVYKPSDIIANIDATQPQQATFSLGANKPGGWNSDTSGTLAGYRIDWGTSTSYGQNTGYFTTGTRTLTGLSVNTTYYYKITCWNTLGLSETKTGSFKTANFYGPTISTPSWSATGTGVSVSSTITKTGGVSQDSSTITNVKLNIKPISSSTWQTVATDTSGSRDISFTYNGGFAQSGSYDLQLAITNAEGMTTTSSTTLSAPAKPTASNITNYHNFPNTFQCTAKTTSSGATSLSKWRFDTTSPTATQGAEQATTALTVNELRTAFGLDFSTTYSANVKVWNRYGLWEQSQDYSFTTNNRFQWYIVNSTYPSSARKKVNPYFRFSNAPTTSRQIQMTYLVVKDALSGVSVGSDISNKRLGFIEEPLFYFAEAVASIKFTNGKTIAYALDSTDGFYKYGIWNGSTLQTTFFDGLEWQMTHYDLGDNWVVQSIVQSSRGLGHSPVFSTTSCRYHHYGD